MMSAVACHGASREGCPNTAAPTAPGPTGADVVDIATEALSRMHVAHHPHYQQPQLQQPPQLQQSQFQPQLQPQLQPPQFQPQFQQPQFQPQPQLYYYQLQYPAQPPPPHLHHPYQPSHYHQQHHQQHHPSQWVVCYAPYGAAGGCDDDAAAASAPHDATSSVAHSNPADTTGSEEGGARPFDRYRYHPNATHPRGANNGVVDWKERIKDQQGSRTWQHIVKGMDCDKVVALVDELAEDKDRFVGAVCDPFGNYFVKTVACHHGHEVAVSAALTRGLCDRVCEVAQDKQGTRVLQAVFDEVERADVDRLVNEFRGRVAEVACTKYGVYAVAGAFRRTHAGFILDEVATSLMALSTNTYGAIAVQRVLAIALHVCFYNEAGDLARVYEALGATDDAAALSIHKSGNYVVSLLLGDMELLKSTLDNMNVDSSRDSIVRSFIHMAAHKSRLRDALIPAVGTMAHSSHGSRVAELILKRMDPEQFHEFYELVDETREFDDMHKYPYGKYFMDTMRTVHKKHHRDVSTP